MKSFLTFMAGLGLGIAISWSYNKNKYEQAIGEEVKPLENKKRSSDIDNSSERVYEEHLKEEAKNIINYSGYSKKDKEDESIKMKNPLYVITPDEFASQVGYDTDTFYIFADDVITNDNNEKIDDVRKTFGLDINEIKAQFGIYEDDSVYIRNEKIQTDYEILRELDTYEKRNGE
jgi:hypothetical protein